MIGWSDRWLGEERYGQGLNECRAVEGDGSYASWRDVAAPEAVAVAVAVPYDDQIGDQSLPWGERHLRQCSSLARVKKDRIDYMDVLFEELSCWS